MHRALLLAVVLLGALAPAAAAAPQPRIINGSRRARRVPGAGLPGGQPRQRARRACGGTVVAPRKFVTAGHCVADEADQPRPPTAFRVFLGQVNQSNFGLAERPVVSAAALHPDYGARMPARPTTTSRC